MTSGSIRNDVSAQPGSQQTFDVLAGPPWGVVFEQQRDDRFDGDDVDDAVLVAEPLIDQAGNPSQASGVIGKQFGPHVPEHRAGIRECDQGFARHVAPAGTMTCVDKRVE